MSLRAREADDMAKEYRLKAAFLYNFTKFVEWPPDRFETASAPIVIGVFGSEPFAEELEKTVRGRVVNGRSIVVRNYDNLEAARGAHVVFLPAGEEEWLQKGDQMLHAAAVLTVGESERFAALGGMIAFSREADKVRFAINLAASEQARLKLSAQLLKLATSVRRKS